MNGKNYNNRKISCKSCFQSTVSWWKSVDFPNESTDLPTCSGTNISIRNQSTMRTRWQRLQQHISSCCRPWLSAWRMKDFSWRIGSLKHIKTISPQEQSTTSYEFRNNSINYDFRTAPYCISTFTISPRKKNDIVHFFCRWTSKSHVKSTSNPHQTQLKCS